MPTPATSAPASGRDGLRVLIANESVEALANLAPVVASLGHTVIARIIDPAMAAETVTREQPDVALVGVGPSRQHALETIGRIVQERVCPVIALTNSTDPEFVVSASRTGVFAVMREGEALDWPPVLEVVLRRYADIHQLRGAFDRRATIERANGILMERHQVSADGAFSMLRDHARRSNSKLVDVAQSVITGVILLRGAQPQ